MSRWKRVLVGRQDRSPAVWLNFTGALPPASPLEGAEEQEARGGGRRTGANRQEPAIAAKEDEYHPERVPQPAVPEPRSHDHENAKPARRAPAVHSSHQAMIVRLDLVPNRFAYRHMNSSAAGCGIEIQRGYFRAFDSPRISSAQRRPNLFSWL